MDILNELDVLPNCPFFTMKVADKLKQLFGTFIYQNGRYDVVHKDDAYGSYWRVRTKHASARPVVLISHMDHPALVFDRKGKGYPLGSIGGTGLKASTSIATQSAQVHLFTPAGEFIRESEVVINTNNTAFQLKGEIPNRPETIGIWQVGKPQVRNGVLYCRSADNHIPTSIALKALEELIGLKADFDITIVFPAVEEIYQLSMTELCLRRSVPVLGFDEDVIFIVLEAMEMLWSEGQGKIAERLKLLIPTYSDGPLIKVNDSNVVYGEKSRSSQNFAEALLVNSGLRLGIAFQNTISGGVSDATALSVLTEYPHIACLAVPCHNKHNVSQEGRIVQETVNTSDVEASVRLIVNSVLNIQETETTHSLSKVLRQSRVASSEMVKQEGDIRIKLLQHNRPRIEKHFFLPKSADQILSLVRARLSL
jgi:putative aminopeptidase FrvX